MKKLLLLIPLMAICFVANCQTGATKIDIVNTGLYVYDENSGNRWIYSTDTVNVSGFTDIFKDSTDILTVQIYTPQKRVVKYYDVQNALPNSSIYLNYIDMDSTDQSIVDTFIQQIKDL